MKVEAVCNLGIQESSSTCDGHAWVNAVREKKGTPVKEKKAAHRCTSIRNATDLITHAYTFSAFSAYLRAGQCQDVHPFCFLQRTDFGQKDKFDWGACRMCHMCKFRTAAGNVACWLTTC
eukprot:305003-Chlamydomonas_euryale.AAC.3